MDAMVPMNFLQWLVGIDWHVVAELFLSYVQALAWPAVVVTAVLVFRKQIKDKIGGLESAKAAGAEATFFQNALQNPDASEDTKLDIAKLWKAISAVQNLQTQPGATESDSRTATTDHLASWTIQRASRPGSMSERRKTRSGFRDEILNMLLALTDVSRFSLSLHPNSVVTQDSVTVPDFALVPVNGDPEVPVFITFGYKNGIIPVYPETKCLIFTNQMTESISDWAAAHPQSRLIDWHKDVDHENLLAALEHLGLLNPG